MEPRVGACFLALSSGFWLVKELAPVVFIPFGIFEILLIPKGIFLGFEWDRLLPELRNPPLFDIRALAREPLQTFENTQDILCDVGMGFRPAFQNKGAGSA